MFNRLRIFLTLINVAVVGIIFLFFVSSIYITMSNNTRRQSAEMMMLAIKDANTGFADQNFFKTRQWARLNIFFIKTDVLGQVTATSPNIPLSGSQPFLLVQEVAKLRENSGTIRLDGETYRFLTATQMRDRSLTFVFSNTRNEKEILGVLLASLVISGLVVLSLVFLGSFFLANRALIPIQKSWERQRSFVADASHELRTPLTVIQTNLELVMENEKETVGSQLKWLENIGIENRRMTRLVNDLLFLARTDSDQATMEFSSFPLHEVLQESLKAFEPLAAEKGLELEADVTDQVIFWGDENRIRQLVIILVDNAVKYTPAGGRIRVALKNMVKNVEISVSDTGEGIDRDDQEKIFQRFYRVDKSRSRECGGVGLGLSIADWITKEHRGTIKVRSSPGEGSTFQVTLPCLKQGGEKKKFIDRF